MGKYVSAVCLALAVLGAVCPSFAFVVVEAKPAGPVVSAEAAALIEQQQQSLGKRPTGDIDSLLLRQLTRALLAERRAARNRAGYDLLRHLALARLLRGRNGAKRMVVRPAPSLKIGDRR